MPESTDVTAVKTHYTAYEVIKLLESETGLIRPTQMGYNYVKKGFIKSEQIGTQNLVPAAEAFRWVRKFAADVAERANA